MASAMHNVSAIYGIYRELCRQITDGFDIEPLVHELHVNGVITNVEKEFILSRTLSIQKIIVSEQLSCVECFAGTFFLQQLFMQTMPTKDEAQHIALIEILRKQGHGTLAIHLEARLFPNGIPQNDPPAPQ